MKDKRAIIIIKNPKLQKIRNNLRTVFLKAINTELIRLLNERRKLKINSNDIRGSIDDLSPSELKRYRQLQKQESNLRESSYRSILMCVSCNESGRDMVYNKAYNAWYCTECYGLHLAAARERFDIRPYLQLPEDHPFFTGKSYQTYNTLMTETDTWLDSLIIERLMMYDKDIDENDLRNEFYKLPPKLQKLDILEAWLLNPDFAENLKKFNEKRKEGKKKPSIYKYNNYFFRVQTLPTNARSKQKRKGKTKPQGHEEETMDDLYRSFL